VIGDVTGKSVLVIGGTRGIGLAIAVRLSQGGAFVGVTGRSAGAAKAVVETSLQGSAKAYALDVTDREAIVDLINRSDGGPDGSAPLVSTAGSARRIRRARNSTSPIGIRSSTSI